MAKAAPAAISQSPSTARQAMAALRGVETAATVIPAP